MHQLLDNMVRSKCRRTFHLGRLCKRTMTFSILPGQLKLTWSTCTGYCYSIYKLVQAYSCKLYTGESLPQFPSEKLPKPKLRLDLLDCILTLLQTESIVLNHNSLMCIVYGIFTASFKYSAVCIYTKLFSNKLFHQQQSYFCCSVMKLLRLNRVLQSGNILPVSTCVLGRQAEHGPSTKVRKQIPYHNFKLLVFVHQTYVQY